MYRIPLVYVTNSYGPMPGGDQIAIAYIPISARGSNRLVGLTDGLYLGTQARAQIVYVDTVGGSDTAGSTTFKTLDYCLSQLVADGNTGTSITSDTIIALHSGQTFTLNQRIRVASGKALTFTFYADPTYGYGFDPMIGGTMMRTIFENITPPVLTFSSYASGSEVRMYGFDLETQVELYGIRVELPAPPSPTPTDSAYGNYLDAFRTAADNASLKLYGCIVNRQDTASRYGLLGCLPQHVSPKLYGYATQFTIAGSVVDSTTAPTDSAVLASRAYFVKMYADYPGNNQSKGSLVQSSTATSTGTSILTLSWSETTREAGTNGSYSRATTPPLFGAAWGFVRNWVWGVMYSQQNTPMNVLTGRQA